MSLGYFSTKSLSVHFANNDESETFDLSDEEDTNWELRVSFQQGWVVIYFFDTTNNKPGSATAYPAHLVREVSTDLSEVDEPADNEVP